ncbi:hypothetical protein CLUG_05638 [Clavispora lusitaniae ATCC 42720]|uniref:Uncharacterized protein n=1 Tax=Clavispora lusitaniae (strain ATCC 42720) TaxID=306902 RepID=C4YBR0_CLAL4|nr:uncharacterized protein CLUG_05638 [Clavispora lusitaniae ATCC 42720]EEQ41510.1 hypothetical protein CLUG_05638 [Clavispora lusitaniae ATCC 42720]
MRWWLIFSCGKTDMTANTPTTAGYSRNGNSGRSTASRGCCRRSAACRRSRKCTFRQPRSRGFGGGGARVPACGNRRGCVFSPSPLSSCCMSPATCISGKCSGRRREAKTPRTWRAGAKSRPTRQGKKAAVSSVSTTRSPAGACRGRTGATLIEESDSG